MTLYLHRNQTPGFIAVVCMFFDTLIPAFAPPEQLGWLRWRVPLVLFAVIALIFLVIQLFILSNQEHEREKREKDQDEKFGRIEGLMLEIRTGKEVRIVEESIQNMNIVPVTSPRERLEQAQEALFVDEVTRLSIPDLKLRLAQDLGFRDRFYPLPVGRYPRFDEIRQLIARDPIIAARIIRAHLVPREPFAQQIREVYDLMKKQFDSTSDFLFQIHLVNITDNSTTIDAIEVEAEIKGIWTPFRRLDDLSDYQIIFEKPGTEGHQLMNLDAPLKDLEPLWPKIRGVEMKRGIAYEGWLRFEASIPSTELDKPLQHKIRIVDSLGGIHPVVVSPSHPPESTGRIRHSPQVYARLRS